MTTLYEPEQCHHCAEGGIVTAATTRGHWVDGDGVPLRLIVPLCNECLLAGDPTGPGYVEDKMRLRDGED